MKSLRSNDKIYGGFSLNKLIQKVLTNTSSAIVILFTGLVFSCVSYTESFQPKEISATNFTPDYLKEFEEVSFKIAIDAFWNHFGGILVGKKIDTNHYRFAFLNEFGGKMLDFELINQELKLNYAIDELNKKIILNLLKKDFNLLFQENNEILRAYENNGYQILESRINQKPVYYFLRNNILEKTVLTGNQKEKIGLTYKYKEPDFPDVEINHGKLKIKIYLHLLGNN